MKMVKREKQNGHIISIIKLVNVNIDIENNRRKTIYYHSNEIIYKTKITEGDSLISIVKCKNIYGKPLYKGSFKNGNGIENEYDPKGHLINTVNYTNGRMVDGSFSIDKAWNDSDELNNYAWKIYEKKSNSKRIKQAIIWIKRSIELDKNYYNTDTYAALLYKMGNYKKALTMAIEAIKLGKKDKNDVTETEKIIVKIKNKLKR